MKIFLNTIYKSKLIFKNRVYKCQIGKNGTIPQYKKKEGDKSTPLGKWKILSIILRKDRNFNFKINKLIKSKVRYLKKHYLWCDDPESLKYNKLVKNKNFNFSHEKLYRNDNIYDIILELNHNQSPSIKNKGSAIFIHCSFGDLRPTLGCVALKKNNLKFLINNLQKQNYIYIR